MRKCLDRLYVLSGVAAAAFLVAIFLVVLAQVGANVLDYGLELITGESWGLVVPSYAEIAGFFLAAASFFALPYTLRHGAHIRVTLVLMHMPKHVQKIMAFVVCVAGAWVSILLSWHLWILVFESYEFEDLSSGLVPIALWIPQLPLAIGTTILAISLVDSAFRCRNSQDPACKLVEGSE